MFEVSNVYEDIISYNIQRVVKAKEKELAGRCCCRSFMKLPCGVYGEGR